MRKNTLLLWTGRVLVAAALLLRAAGAVHTRSPLLWGLLLSAAFLILLSGGGRR